MEKPITFRVQQQQLIGMLHMPDEASAPAPAVVFLHGFRGNKQEAHRMFVKMARALCAAGIAALRFDYRGSGDSEGEFSQVTITGELKDAAAALRFIRRRKGIDPARVGLAGMSMGGMVAVLAAARDPGLKAVALWSALANPRRSAQEKTTPTSTNQLQQMGFTDMNGWAVGAALVRDLMSLRPLAAAAQVNAPVLLVHGDQDTTVPVEDAHAYEAVFKAAGRQVVKHIVPGAEHTYDSIPWETEVIGLTLEWFRKYL
ncbi:MAG: alpha/beta fold hydrolase [Kiritimatiellae bacterium]|nr:alpha/beta fold hydrolase [Kiritimatiellia bacterium]